jgi:hypothetical protein
MVGLNRTMNEQNRTMVGQEVRQRSDKVGQVEQAGQKSDKKSEPESDKKSNKKSDRKSDSGRTDKLDDLKKVGQQSNRFGQESDKSRTVVEQKSEYVDICRTMSDRNPTNRTSRTEIGQSDRNRTSPTQAEQSQTESRTSRTGVELESDKLKLATKAAKVRHKPEIYAFLNS